MMPLSFAGVGEQNTIKKICGRKDEKKHLEDLGFTVGETVSVVSCANGNVIVNIRDVRVAISREMAQKILV